MGKSEKGLKNIRFLICLICILLVITGVYFIVIKNKKEDLRLYLEKGEVLIDYTTYDSYTYALVGKQGEGDYGDFFVAFENKNGDIKRIYEKDFKNYNPWKIKTADVDGDKIGEILIAVKTDTPYDKEIKNRMFIFNFENRVLTKKWTGSQIAGTWRDFYTGDVFSSPGHELLFIETVDDMEKISVYSWFDFGFIKVAESEIYKKIEDIRFIDSNCIEVTYEADGDMHKHILTAADGKLKPSVQEN